MRSYKTELDPTNVQRTAFLKHAGAARWAYNWGLRRKIEAYEATGKSPSAIDLHRELNRLKQTEIPWMYDVSKCAPQEALRNLDVAFKNFFRRCKAGKGKPGYPRFKSRKRGIGSCSLTGMIGVADRAIQLPRIGKVRLKERGYLPTAVRIVRATVTERAGRWFVSVLADQEPRRERGTEIIGVDVGIKSLAVCSDGTVFENPRALKRAEKRLYLLQKSVSRKRKGSRNRRKAVHRLSRQHYRTSCVRSDAIHKATDAIAKRAAIVGIESLNVAGMVKNHRLARAVSDASMSEFHRQIDYKMSWSGGEVVKADRWFPSSKTCSACGLIKEDLTLADREFECECGFVADRDLNAAINLRNMAASSAVSACRLGSAGREPSPVKLLIGQEPNTIEAVGLGG
uniref:Putative transposase n=1 Tax=viral metagenome TaxID=1070528 RepID=A0A6M3M850_9ZZZZ